MEKRYNFRRLEKARYTAIYWKEYGSYGEYGIGYNLAELRSEWDFLHDIACTIEDCFDILENVNDSAIEKAICQVLSDKIGEFIVESEMEGMSYII